MEVSTTEQKMVGREVSTTEQKGHAHIPKQLLATRCKISSGQVWELGLLIRTCVSHGTAPCR